MEVRGRRLADRQGATDAPCINRRVAQRVCIQGGGMNLNMFDMVTIIVVSIVIMKIILGLWGC